MAKFFIDRPVFASVLSILITIIGLVCIFTLPVAQFPEIAPPTVVISASYPGASAEAAAESVAAPIEQELSGIRNLLYFSSQCSNDGGVSIACTFEIGTDQDIAAVEVQNRLARAQPRLPQEVVQGGISVNKASTQILFIAALQSDDPQYDPLFLTNYATINVVDALRRVKGAGDVAVYGGKDYAMRLWLNPDRMAQRLLAVSDVAAAVAEQNGQYAAGRLGAPPNSGPVELTIPAITRGRLQTPEEFDNIILRANPDGSMLRLKDVGRAELGSQSYDLYSNLNGRPSALIVFYLQAGANALSSFEEAKQILEEVSWSFPQGVTYTIPYDTVVFVEESIEKVVHTFFEAVILVLLVVFLFLQSWRATLIPLIAVPVSIIGAFAGIMALGFTINTLTLFGLILAIGIVVDDAIVVVENVERVMADEGLPVREATIKAMDEVTGPVIAIVLVLCAVFVPVAFLGGLTGQMYKQFAVTIAISVLLSGIVALTLSPALCRMLLKESHGKPPFILFRWFNAAFDAVTRAYVALCAAVIRHKFISLGLFLLLCGGVAGMFRVVPGGFVPPEDQGAYIVYAGLPNGASIERTEAVSERIEKWLMEQPEVKDVLVLGGNNLLAGGTASSDAATIYVTLKPFRERTRKEQHVEAIVQRTNIQFAGEQEARVIAFNLPPIQGLGTRIGFDVQLQARSGQDVRDLAAALRAFLAAANERPELDGVAGVLSINQPQLFIDLNRDKAKATGTPISEVFRTLQAYFGSLYINDFVKFGRVYRVQAQAEPEFRQKPEDVARVFVRNSAGNLVPLSELVTLEFQAGPNFISRFNGFPAVQVTGAPAPGRSSGEALQVVQEVAWEALPAGFGTEWSGASYQEVKSGNQAPLIMLFGLLIVFLVLAAQYEQWSLPVAVLLSIPLGLLGALTAVWMRGLQNDIYFQIGILTLIGLAAKNAILIVEFCVVARRAGKSLVDSALEAARLRLRPILMTSLAFILGCVPLAISTGAGSAGRHSIGTGIIGGMVSATILGVIFVPLFFVIVQGLSERFGGRNGTGKADGTAKESAGH